MRDRVLKVNTPGSVLFVNVIFRVNRSRINFIIYFIGEDQVWHGKARQKRLQTNWEMKTIHVFLVKFDILCHSLKKTYNLIEFGQFKKKKFSSLLSYSRFYLILISLLFNNNKSQTIDWEAAQKHCFISFFFSRLVYI